MQYREAKFNIFEPYTESATSDPPSTICPIHPKAAPNVQALTHKQRELLYHETRGHDGYFKAIGLFQFFFELCPPGQRVLIQLTNEVFPRISS
jgi:hypothetical protein